MGWTFLWLMLALKVPIGMLLYIVWWAAHATPEEDGAGGEGGSKAPPLPRRPFPPRRPRGPHGELPLPSPPRTRTAPAKARPVPRD